MRKMRDEVICAMRQAFGFYSSQIRRKNLTARWRNTSLWLKGCYRYRLRVNVPLPGKFNFDVGINEKNRATQRKEKREREGRKKKRKTKLGQDCHFKFEWEFFLLFFLFFFSLSLFFFVFFWFFWMLGSEASIACTNLSSRAKTIRSSVNLTNKTYVRVTEFYLILVYFRSLLFSFSPRCFDLLSLLFLVFYPVRLLLHQSHSRALYSSSLRHGCKWLLLFQSFLFPFTSCSGGLVGTKRQLSKFEFLLLFFSFLSFAYLNEHFLRPSPAHADNGFVKAVGLRASSTHSISDSPSLSHCLFF